MKKILLPSWLVFLLLGLIPLENSCNRKPFDGVLKAFPSVEVISPTDSVKLDDYDILMPDGIVVRNDRIFISHSDGDDVLSLLEHGDRHAVFRRGRGPREFLEPTSLQINGTQVNLFDKMRRLFISFDADSQDCKNVKIDTLAQITNLGADGYSAPVYLYSVGTAFISAGYQPGYWYALVDAEGRILDGVGYVSFKGMDDFSDNENYVLHLNSYMAFHPDGDKGVCVMADAGVISLFEIRGNTLEEYYREIYSLPLVEGTKDPRYPILHNLPDSFQAFRAVDADETHIYALYSGNKWTRDDRPAYECTHLLVFDWAGNTIKHYELSESINAFQIVGDQLYGVSMHPSSRLFIFQI